MKTSFGALLLGLVFLSASAQTTAPSPRTWTSSDGKKMEATFQGREGAGVKVKMANGAIFTIPLDRLSAEDQAYVRQQPAAEASGAKPGALAALKEWPRGVALDEPPQPKVITEDPAKKEFIYRSGHYEFRCDSKLGANVVKEFSRIFEATHLLNWQLPLDFKPKPEEGQEVFMARLYTNKEDYFANGGMTGSAGVYQRGEKALSVPLSSLGVKMVGSRVSLEKTSDDDNATLIHEITHQMMNHWLPKLRTWYVEGSAEAIAMLEYQRGRFTFIGVKQRLSNFLQRRGSDGKNFTMLDPEELFALDGQTWSAALASIRGQASQNYASAGLMAYFFYYLDGKGDAANIIAYLRELEAGDRNAEPEAFKKHLLRERSMDDFREEVKKAFRKEGLNITFAPMGKNTAVSAP
jgi:hypothetical protein